MTGRPDWRSSALLATTVVGIAFAAIIAFVTIDAPPLPARRAKASTVAAPTPPTARVPDIKLPVADAPPAPTGADFAAKRADAPTPPPAPETDKPTTSTDWASLPIEDVRTRANASEILAMEEIARRLIQGVGVAKDPQAGAGWLLRAAEAGSAQAAFNVGVMYERGFVVERDSSRAVEWYRKSADGNMPAAKHNLALLLRDGKGAPRDTKRAIELLHSAARQGMAASMFSLGDMYERGDAGQKDPAAALAWFAIAAEFERQINRGEDTPLARTADQRSQTLQRVLTPAELQRAQQLGQAEFRAIAEALAPPKPSPPPVEPTPPPVTTAPALPPASDDLSSWPKAPAEQIRAIQQALADLQLLRDKPDGVLGPMTRNAIRDFQRGAGLRASSEPSKEVYLALRQALVQRDIATSPLPFPPKQEPAKNEPQQVAAKPEPPVMPVTIDLGKPEPPPAPPTTADFMRTLPKPKAAKSEPQQVAAKAEPPLAPVTIDLGKPDPPPAPPTSADLARALPKPQAARRDPPKPAPPKVDPAPPPPPRIDIAKPDPPPPPTSIDLARTIAKADPNAWPVDGSDQVKAIQRLLRELKILAEPVSGQVSTATRAAIREYERLAGLKETGEPSKALFDSLKETRALMVPKTRSN
jgi:peptidoglycan hydrolase-like protein with peptidoglycan-binding domain